MSLAAYAYHMEATRNHLNRSGTSGTAFELFIIPLLKLFKFNRLAKFIGFLAMSIVVPGLIASKAENFSTLGTHAPLALALAF
jgi:hypothetical protein